MADLGRRARLPPDWVTVLPWLSPTLMIPLQMMNFGGMPVVLVALFGILVWEVAQPRLEPAREPAPALP